MTRCWWHSSDRPCTSGRRAGDSWRNHPVSMQVLNREGNLAGRELLKLPGYGRTTPLLGKAVYVAGPASPPKERFKTLEATVIKNYEKFDPAPFAQFIERITKTKGGTL